MVDFINMHNFYFIFGCSIVVAEERLPIHSIVCMVKVYQQRNGSSVYYIKEKEYKKRNAAECKDLYTYVKEMERQGTYPFFYIFLLYML